MNHQNLLKINAPITIGIFLTSLLVQILYNLGIVDIAIFSNPKNISVIIDIFRLFSPILAHSDWNHFFGNFSLFIIIGTIIEEKYGSDKIWLFILITSVITSLVGTYITLTYGIGISGVLYMLIILSSIPKNNESIPLSFIFVFGIYIGQEILNSFKEDNISQEAHIIGGIIGAVIGFYINRQRP